MRRQPGSMIPPHCFCAKPAIRIHTEYEGLVFECHYTCPFLWLEHRTGPFSPQDSESSLPAKNTPGSSRSTPTSQPSPVLSTCRDSHSPFQSPDKAKTREAIKDVVDSLMSITKKDPSLPWGVVSRDQQRFSRNKPRSDSSFHDSSNSYHQPSKQKTLATSSISAKIVTSSSRPQVLVCGFHLHESNWELFKRLVKEHNSGWSGAMSEEAISSKEEGQLARQHLEIVLRHKDIRIQLLLLAEKIGCDNNTTTVRRWVNHKDGADGKTTLTRGPPICFCRQKMKLSWTFNGSGSNAAYFCAQRLADAKGGCSMMRKVDRWAQFQAPDPIHTLAPIQRAAAADSLDTDNGADTDEVDYSSDTTSDYRRSENNQGEDMQLNSAGAGEVEHEESEMEQERAVEESWSDTEGLWDNCVSSVRPPTTGSATRRRLRPLPIPEGHEDSDGEVDGFGSKSKTSSRSPIGSSAMLPTEAEFTNGGHESAGSAAEDCIQDENRSRHDVVLDGDLAQWHANDHNSSLYEDSVPTKSLPPPPESSGDMSIYLGQDLISTIDDLTDRLRFAHQTLEPEAAMVGDKLKEIVARLQRWRDSTGRLKEYAGVLYEDGLDNPTLKCRRCKEGPLLRVNVPCFHLVMCDSCIYEHQYCVICHSGIETSRRIYWG
ncbi:hypothetical protein BC939DRAFT_442808 [Gamsiella multidivaricata]|uniref:uncharacterized protein n=1 Tax=Gamsiella multidivaricata TaxID=101098 RepID=UPI00221FD7A4|nr:uncharacterized protein BC939DRAFT_442808 [Gamsiella multidivaricata]KAG0367545.1 hypothetical protein BGZ54_003704 [Gamsiella multidivaricata]KAI7828744.1 hypothetical protein BC939DRAFT_442808 [Gamsiella multidivaricata]